MTEGHHGRAQLDGLITGIAKALTSGGGTACKDYLTLPTFAFCWYGRFDCFQVTLAITVKR